VNLEKRGDEPSLGHELRTAGATLSLPFLGIGVVVVLLGLLITKVLENSVLADADGWLIRRLADARTPTGETLTHYGTLLGETPTIVGLTALTAAAFRVAFHRWRESVLLVCCVTGQALIFLVTTILIDRNRPNVPHLDDSPPTSSFPSGHTAASTAFYAGAALIIAWHTRDLWFSKLIAVVGILLPITVAFCRMYRGMHYPTDTTTSFLLGLSLLAVAFHFMPLTTRTRVGAPA
jgi:membrane-associated phospholipid phosphatase